jgi:hypothetical protein
MPEPIIKDIVRVEGGYAAYVNLQGDFLDDTRNVGRMERYRPISSHRQAFQALAKSLQLNDMRVYLLTGSYGTGKSHLCLMFANYMQTPASETPMPSFFKNYAEVDPNGANTLQTSRSTGRYLIALCDWGGREDFEEVVLKAVDEALRREGFGDELDTPYLEAVKQIDKWESLASEGSPQFIEAFERELGESDPGVTLPGFKKRLRGYDHASLQEFKRLHPRVTTTQFTYDKAHLVDILTSTLSSEKFKERFLGLLVMFDEFGHTMEQGNLNPKAFQKFAELCEKAPTSRGRLVFVGTAHKSFQSYGKSYNANDFRVASDRVKEVQLTPDGVEEIISAIVVPQKQHALWQEHVAPRTDVFDTFTNDCTRLKLFEWLKAPQVRQRVIEDIYPMHPMATFALLQLARDVASNNRSVYTFFSEDAPGSYSDFIRTAPIMAGSKLNLYTVDRLCDYFSAGLSSDNKELRDTVRDQIRDYEETLKTLNRVAEADLSASILKSDPLIPRMLRAMLVYEIINKPNRLDNLAFGLYCTTEAERKELKNRLDVLIEKNVLYYNKENGVYEFKRSTAVNIDSLIEDYVKNPANEPHNIVAELETLVPLGKDVYFEAKDYNATYSEDKRLERRLVRAVDLGTETDTSSGKRSYFDLLEDEITASIAKKNEYEGLALYVVCERAEDISKARDYCSRNHSDRIIVAIPKEPIPFRDAVLELKALQYIERSEEKKNFTTQDNAALNSRLHGDGSRPGARKNLEKLRDQLANVKHVTWYGKYAAAMVTDDLKPYDASNQVMERLYTGRNTFSHDAFNKLHDNKDLTKPALKEAVEELLDYSEPIIIDTEYSQQRGDLRYLQRCLLNYGALRQVKAEGSKLRCEIEDDPNKYATRLPALAAMVREVQSLGDRKLKIADWIQRYRRPEYGQGPIAQALFLACLRRSFGDSIRFKVDEAAVGDMRLKSFDEVLTLVNGTCPNAFLSYRPLSKPEKGIVNFVYANFGSPGNAATQEFTVVEAHGALRSWWDVQPAIAKVAKIYPDKNEHTASFISVMEKVAGKDAHAFLFDELPTAFGFDPGLAITEEVSSTLTSLLPSEKETVEDGLLILQERILAGVRSLFGVQGSTISDLIDGISDWYNGLDNNQRDAFGKWHINESKPLVAHLGSLTDAVDMFLKTIPKTPEYFGREVKDWQTDQVVVYLDRMKRGKEHIEDNKIKVDPPELEVGSECEWIAEGQLSFRDSATLHFKKPTDGAKVWVTEGSVDPSDSAGPRHEIENGDALVVTGNKTIRYAVQDVDGNWSPTKAVQLTNLNAPFVPTVGDPDLFGLRSVTFNLKDPDSLAVACRDLFRQCIQLGVMNESELEVAVMKALSAAKDGK